MKIDSAKSEKVKYIIRLQQKARFRKKEGLFVCEGERLVREVPPALLEEVYVAEGAQFAPKTEAWLSNMRGGGATVHILGEAAYQRVSEVVHPQGILALARMPERWEPLADEAGTAPLLLFLENLQDPGNLGTILRAAEAAGATGVVCSAGCVDFYSPKVVRSTMGSIFRVKHASEDEEGFLRQIEAARKRGIPVYGATLSADSIPYDEADLSGGAVLVVGNEGAGLSERAVAACGRQIMIPMQGEIESLNAAMAAGLLLFEAARQRRRSGA